MKIKETNLAGVLIIEPTVFGDDRGFFYESFNEQKFEQLTGLRPRFVQDNHSKSSAHVLRGMHYQIKQAQGKLVRVIAGEVFDVAVDLRKNSPTFGQWTGTYLSAQNKLQMWIPEGFAHGFVVTSDSAEFLYKTTDFWAPEHERCLMWNDPSVNIDWPLTGANGASFEPIMSAKDLVGKALADAEVFE